MEKSQVHFMLVYFLIPDGKENENFWKNNFDIFFLLKELFK